MTIVYKTYEQMLKEVGFKEFLKYDILTFKEYPKLFENANYCFPDLPPEMLPS